MCKIQIKNFTLLFPFIIVINYLIIKYKCMSRCVCVGKNSKCF